MGAIRIPLTAFTTDVGGAGSAPPAAPAPAEPAAPASTDPGDIAAGILERASDALETPGAGAPTEGAAADGAPAPDGEDDPLAGIDFENLSYRQGKLLEKELKSSRDRYKPFADTVGKLPDDQRAVVAESLATLGDDTAAVVPFVAQMHPNDRKVLFDAYSMIGDDRDAAAAAFRAIADELAAPEGAQPTRPPEGAAAPAAAGVPDPDAPLTRAEYEAMRAAEQATADQERATAAQAEAYTSEARALGYDPTAAKGTEEDSRFQELMLTAAVRTDGDLGKADAMLKARGQAIIDRYLDGKRADARIPGTPDTGSGPDGSVDPSTLTPEQKAEAIFAAQLGPDRTRLG